MTAETTYLELSAGSAHKFYEVTLNDTQVTIRFGRIGDRGQASTSTYPTLDKARTEASKKINQKLKSGYERAIMGGRAKRPITRRSLEVSHGTPAPRRTQRVAAAHQAPVLWRFASGADALGIFIDQDMCWVGNQAGQVFALDQQQQVQARFTLPDGVKCIVADDVWLYAGCDDGKVYDLSGKTPRVAYEIAEEVDIFWLDIRDGILAVSDRQGRVTIINHDDESQWAQQSPGSHGWMVRCDEIGVYHGHANGVTMYDWEDGRVIWQRPTAGAVLFGWQEETTVYACTSHGKVHSFTKDGTPGPVYQCDEAVFACATAPDGRYVFAGDNRGAIYCFAQAGERLWKLATGCGSAYSMQFFHDCLYIVTTAGTLACIDASEAAIQAAQAGTVPTAVDIKAPQGGAATVSALETTTERGQGVMVECYQEGSKLRVRVISEGYNAAWHCQFPKDIRTAGARYVVDEVRQARGNFYRVYGNIRQLVP